MSSGGQIVILEPKVQMLVSRVFRVLIAAAVLTAACTADYSSGPRAPAPVASVAVGPTALVLEIGQTKQLTAFVADAEGHPLSGRVVTWATDSPDVALVSDAGLVTATGPGYVTIVATCEGKTFSVAATVTDE
jgi:uncharacterized protein YjdB